MSNNTPQPETQHPEEWRQDLNPDLLAGRNVATSGPHPEKNAPTAYDVKEAHDRLASLSDAALKRIPILPPGSRLEQGATYIDLKHLDRGEFTATANMEAGDNNWYVPKTEVDYQLWNRLIGVDNPERLGLADEA